ncbi:MAG: TlpA family protein disulfide reductase [Cyclobacteriaceae bacterium]
MKHPGKALLISSISLALFINLLALFFVDFVWISILLYAVLIFWGYSKNLTVIRNIVLINLPFLILHLMPLALHHHVVALYQYNPPYLLYNYAASMVYTQVCIIACLMIRAFGVTGLIYTLVFALVIYTGFESWSIQLFLAGATFMSMATFLEIFPDKTIQKRFLFFFLPFFYFYILSPLWEPLFMGGEFANWNIKVLPVMLVVPIAIISGLFLKDLAPARKYISLVAMIVLFAFAARLNMTWIAFVSQDKTQRELLSPFALTNYYGDTIHIETLKGDLVVLNLWSTSCGVCIEKFPEIEKLHNAFLDDPGVSFYSVNIPLKRDTKEFIYGLAKDFDTPLLFGDDTLRENLGIRGYPTMVVIKNGEQKYHGIAVFDSYNYYNPYKIISRLLNE